MVTVQGKYATLNNIFISHPTMTLKRYNNKYLNKTRLNNIQPIELVQELVSSDM